MALKKKRTFRKFTFRGVDLDDAAARTPKAANDAESGYGGPASDALARFAPCVCRVLETDRTQWLTRWVGGWRETCVVVCERAGIGWC